jgi:hypothetical protein
VDTHPAFYETTAQLIAVLLIVLGFQSGLFNLSLWHRRWGEGADIVLKASTSFAGISAQWTWTSTSTGVRILLVLPVLALAYVAYSLYLTLWVLADLRTDSSFVREQVLVGVALEFLLVLVLAAAPLFRRAPPAAAAEAGVGASHIEPPIVEGQPVPGPDRDGEPA